MPKNTGYGPGNKGPAKGANDPFSYVKLTKDHGYLGHFRKEKFIEEGHNFVSMQRGGAPRPSWEAPNFGTPGPSLPGLDAASGESSPAGPSSGTFRAAAPLVAPRQTYAQKHPVVAARRRANTDVRIAKSMGPDPAGMAGQRRTAIQAAKANRLTDVRAARANPESAYSEARARRAKRGIY